MEQILIRNLPEGTKAALRARAAGNDRSAEAEAREILTQALRPDEPSLVDWLFMDEAAAIVFEPVRLGLTAREVEL